MTRVPKVYLVDDDLAVLKALSRLMGSVGFEARPYASPVKFLDQYKPAGRACLVLDVRMPEMSGLELQQQLVKTATSLPVVFLSGCGDVPMCVRAMKAGAVDFLTKPVANSVLLDAVERAIKQSGLQLGAQLELARIQEREAALSAREHEVFRLVVTGLLNKQIGEQLGISEKTVKVHRANGMEKMGAASLAELVLMAARLGIIKS